MRTSSRSAVCNFLVIFCCIVVRECVGAEIKGYSTPVQCSKHDCPKYNVIYSEKEFEIRSYSEALWVTAPAVKETSIMVGLGYSAINLTNYYDQENEQKVRIVISGGPVLMMDITKSTCKSYLYVPNKYQNGGVRLPKALRSDIEQVKLPNNKYAAVRRVDRELIDAQVPKEVDAMKKALQRSPPYQRAANRDQFTYVSYGYDGIHFTGYEVLIWFD